MQTKKHDKRKNKLTKQSHARSFRKGGGPSEVVEEIKEKPSYIKHALLMLGLSSSYIFYKLTKVET